MLAGSLTQFKKLYIDRLPSIVDHLGMWISGIRPDQFGSVDITSRCNMRCEHCYYYAHELPRPYGKREWEGFFDRLRQTDFPFYQCTWVGGEPLLRKDLVDRYRKLFRRNTIVTNGTVALPQWPDVSYFVSLDGTREVHRKLRNCSGRVYEKIEANVRAGAAAGLNVYLAAVVTSENMHDIPRFVKHWTGSGIVGITLDFYTPVIGENDDLLPSPGEKNRMIDTLIDLKARGGTIVTPVAVLEMMRPENMNRVVGDACLLRKKGYAFDAAGRRKKKCVMGDRADCARCGCVVPYYLNAIEDRLFLLRYKYGRLTSAVSTFLGRHGQ